MSTIVLTLNEQAAEQLGAHTRVRVKIQKRGGVEYVGLRPSYRVSGKNSMVRTNKNDDGTVTIEIPEDVQQTENLPELKNHGTYQMIFIGYCWSILKEATGTKEDDPAQVTISKRRTRHATQATTAETATAENADAAPSDAQDATATADAGKAAEPATNTTAEAEKPASVDDLTAAGDAEAQRLLESKSHKTDTKAEAAPEGDGAAAPETVEKVLKPKANKTTKKLQDSEA